MPNISTTISSAALVKTAAARSPAPPVATKGRAVATEGRAVATEGRAVRREMAGMMRDGAATVFKPVASRETVKSGLAVIIAGRASVNSQSAMQINVVSCVFATRLHAKPCTFVAVNIKSNTVCHIIITIIIVVLVARWLLSLRHRCCLPSQRG